jgi:hypothetical protein
MHRCGSALLWAMRRSLYVGRVKSATSIQRVMVWAESRDHALDLVEAALTTTEEVEGSVVGPLMSLPADVMPAGVYVEARPASTI